MKLVVECITQKMTMNIEMNNLIRYILAYKSDNLSSDGVNRDITEIQLKNDDDDDDDDDDDNEVKSND